ncbi:MAG: PEP-CTERM sorting domain-containing protein [Burkholderiales bacterium]|nr:PEP-CTERM sorting domain-containing protein [Burkholderiales bacterium]
MTKQHLSAIFFALASLTTSVAHAEIQTWRLTATTTGVSSGFTAPAFASLGHTFSVDYAIDMATPYDAPSGGYKAVKSLTINGVTTQLTNQNYVFAIAANGIGGINTVIPVARADQLQFISYSESWPNPTSTLSSVLSELALMHGQNAPYYPPNELHLNFVGGSVQAHPTSFALSPVPEPTSLGLMLAGLAALGVVARKKSKR